MRALAGDRRDAVNAAAHKRSRYAQVLESQGRHPAPRIIDSSRLEGAPTDRQST